MKTELFDFELPESLIAVHPVSPRDSARMLVVKDSISDSVVSALPKFLNAGDVMVFNDTKVIPARLFGQRGDAKIELLLHKDKGASLWQCFAKPAKKLKAGDTLTIAGDFSAQVVEKLPSGEVMLQFNCSGAAFYEQLLAHGHMPLPPYIEKQRAHGDEAADSTSYQTVYAKHEGSVAAPTAGLHFTDSLLKAIDDIGVQRVHVTLHVGGGTFLPVKSENTEDHVMHSEYAVVNQETADAVNRARGAGGRVIAVGTTSLRTLESAGDDNGILHPFAQETSIFITPGYRFKMVDMLMTNFHLPCSTLFMLVSAFAGLEQMRAAYAHAIAQQYRFYSYGDSSLLYKKDGHE